MTSRHIMTGIGLLILTGCQSMAGTGLPTLTRTGQVQQVVIQEDLSPSSLTVNPGDEIRWTNRRQGMASVIFIDPVMERLSCERNFDTFMKKTDKNQYTANLGSNDSASVCFRSHGQVKYVIRAASADNPAGEVNMPGTIRVAAIGEEALRISAGELRRERDLLRTRSDDLERRLQTAQQDRESAEKAMTAAAAEMAAREKETDRLALALHDAEDAARELKTQLTAEQGTVAALQGDKRQLLGDSTAAQQEITRLQQRAGELETEAARARDLERRLSERDQQLATLSEESAAVKEQREQLAGELTQMRRRLLTEEAARARLEQERQDLTVGLTQARELLHAEAADKSRLEQERAAKEAETARLTATPAGLTNSLKDEIERGDVKIRQGRDRLTINMVDRVLFDSGRAKIKPAGLKVLKQVSDVLRNISDKHIRIEGHTDNVPIGIKLRDKFATNWELSTARATSVVRYLIEEGGVDRLMLEADGYADTRPLEGNDTDEGKAANRRIEIVLYPKELAEIVRQVP